MHFVLDFQLQKRSLYNYFQDWACTKDGKYFLHKYDHKRGEWRRIPHMSSTGEPYVIPVTRRAF